MVAWVAYRRLLQRTAVMFPHVVSSPLSLISLLHVLAQPPNPGTDAVLLACRIWECHRIRWSSSADSGSCRMYSFTHCRQAKTSLYMQFVVVDHVCNTLIALMESFPGTLGFLTALAWARMRAAPSPANTVLCSRGDCGCDNAFDFRGNASARWFVPLTCPAQHKTTQQQTARAVTTALLNSGDNRHTSF